MGISRLVDLLHEKREVIRNGVVLMLSELSRGKIALQQLLAYENTFQLLFVIINQESLDSKLNLKKINNFLIQFY